MTHNGWNNKETSFMAVEIVNDAVIFEEVFSDIIHMTPSSLKEFIAGISYEPRMHKYVLDDAWTKEEFENVNWDEIYISILNMWVKRGMRLRNKEAN